MSMYNAEQHITVSLCKFNICFSLLVLQQFMVVLGKVNNIDQSSVLLLDLTVLSIRIEVRYVDTCTVYMYLVLPNAHTVMIFFINHSLLNFVEKEEERWKKGKEEKGTL